MNQNLFDIDTYSLPQAEKERLLLEGLNQLTQYHRQRCPEYERLLSILHAKFKQATALNEIPFLPVGLFKSHALVSVPKSEVFKILTSSGTTGQTPSRIYLDRETANRQSQALVKIITAIVGHERLPMLIIDSEKTLGGEQAMGARKAGIVGMMSFGHSHVFALNENMELDKDALAQFVQKHGSQKFLLYGFTYMIWQYFYKQLIAAGLDLSNGILVHSGGFKKLQEEQVSNEELKRLLNQATGLRQIHNFYGMVEQIGSVFLEGEDGFLYAPAFADVIVRDPKTFKEAEVGQVGVIQVLSTLPLSYPGHSLLTEDLGIVHGIDDSTCGRKGKRFSVVGRVPKVELRGCSDVHAYERQAVS
jgi:phenylacetate-coenzyme A ligase PaaK-like adenylate-forming protein